MLRWKRRVALARAAPEAQASGATACSGLRARLPWLAAMDPFIGRHLQGVSRTYAVLVPMLPDRLANVVGLAYLLMRVVDTLEDAAQLSTDQRLHYFDQLERALHQQPEAIAALARPVGDTEDERRLMQDAPQVLARVQMLEPACRDALCACARSMMDGVRRLIARSVERGLPYPAIRDQMELREYCYYVAGVVGELLCGILAGHLHQPGLQRARAAAVELGIGLQLVNIIKDVQTDSRQGRRYLPATVDGRAPTEAYAKVLRQARRSLHRGVKFVLSLPSSARELRAFCGLPIAWGAMTLARAAAQPHCPKIGRDAIRQSIQRFAQLADDDHALRRWLLSLLWPTAGIAQAAGADRA